MTFYVYADKSNLCIEGVPVIAVRKDMAKDA